MCGKRGEEDETCRETGCLFYFWLKGAVVVALFQHVTLSFADRIPSNLGLFDKLTIARISVICLLQCFNSLPTVVPFGPCDFDKYYNYHIVACTA